jgi:hypothetical protein
VKTHHVEASYEQKKLHVVELTIEMIDMDPSDELILMVNGRVLRRLTTWQAQRMHLVTDRPF